jgi:hypothetical protein
MESLQGKAVPGYWFDARLVDILLGDAVHSGLLQIHARRCSHSWRPYGSQRAVVASIFSDPNERSAVAYR